MGYDVNNRSFQYEEFSCANYEVLTKILFVLYMFIMPIMLINILIAMMGNTYTTVIAQAEKAWRQQVGIFFSTFFFTVFKDRKNYKDSKDCFHWYFL